MDEQRAMWLATNRTAIVERLQWLKGQGRGVIFTQPSNAYIVQVDKVLACLRLKLIGSTHDIFQSQLNLNDPLDLAARYNQAMLLSLAWQNEPRRIYMAGFGGGCLSLVLHHHFPQAVIECTETDPLLVEVATKFFGVQLDARLKVAIQDARAYLAQAGGSEHYNIIMLDVFLADGQSPYHLVTREFFELCQASLVEEGVVVANLLHPDPFFAEKVKTIQSVFEQVYLCTPWGNRVIIATNGAPLTVTELVDRTQALQEYHQFSFPLIARALEVRAGSTLADYIPHLDQAHILTDLYPPLDWLHAEI